MQRLFERAAEALWGPFTLVMILFFGGYLLIKSRAKFIIKAPISVAKSLSVKNNEISPFMSLSNALAATMGTGNIVGVAAAISSGGPGALFWMQIAAIAGMMIKFAETALAVKCSSIAPGPMGYLQKIKIVGKPLAVLFAISCIAASLGSGCITQSNSAAQALTELSVPSLYCALIFGFVSWKTAGGGVKGIMKLMTYLIPFITVGYIAMSAAVIFKYKYGLLSAFKTILTSAFCFDSFAGGAVGYTAKQAVRFGLARGIFSNEAGMGSSAIAYSLVKQVDAKQQGMLAIAEVFADTVVCCSLTGLVLILTDSYSNLNGAESAVKAFSLGLGDVFGYTAAVFIALFGLAAICGWYTYGIKALEFLLPDKKYISMPFRIIYSLFSAIGAVIPFSAVWAASDFFTGVMMIINLFGMLMLLDNINDIIKS